MYEVVATILGRVFTGINISLQMQIPSWCPGSRTSCWCEMTSSMKWNESFAHGRHIERVTTGATLAPFLTGQQDLGLRKYLQCTAPGKMTNAMCSYFQLKRSAQYSLQYPFSTDTRPASFHVEANTGRLYTSKCK